MRYNFLDTNSNAFISLINDDDAHAFEILLDRYRTKLAHLAFSYVSQIEDSEEIVQDVFVKLWKKRKTIDIKTNLNNYLFSMVKNACLDHLRKKNSKIGARKQLELLENRFNDTALVDDATSRIIEKELAIRVDHAVALLPEKCQQVFIKSRMEGLTHKDISKELHISVKTIENHMTKALRHMRQHLQEFSHFF